MTASELIQQEHAIVQHYFISVKEYQDRKKQITQTSEKQKKEAQSTQEDKKAKAQVKLEEVSEVRATLLGSLETSQKEKLQKRGEALGLVSLPGYTFEQKMDTYHHIQEQLKDFDYSFR